MLLLTCLKKKGVLYTCTHATQEDTNLSWANTWRLVLRSVGFVEAMISEVFWPFMCSVCGSSPLHPTRCSEVPVSTIFSV